MLHFEAAQLIYDGAGMHELKNLEGLESLERLSKSENHALAEYALRKLDYANNFARDASFAIGESSMLAMRIASRQINHIHANCQKDIESRWQRSLSDEEAEALLFQEQIKNMLPDIEEKQELELRL